MDDGAVGDDAYIPTFANHTRFAERNRKVCARVWRAIVWLAVEMFVLEEQNRIVGANGGAQQAAHVQGGGRHHHAKSGNVGEGNLAALAMVDRAAGEISAERYPHH